MTPLPKLLDVTMVAEHLGVTVRHVRRLVAERRIPYLKWGHLLRFDPDQIAAWLRRQEVPAAPGDDEEPMLDANGLLVQR